MKRGCCYTQNALRVSRAWGHQQHYWIVSPFAAIKTTAVRLNSWDPAQSTAAHSPKDRKNQSGLACVEDSGLGLRRSDFHVKAGAQYTDIQIFKLSQAFQTFRAWYI